MATASELRLRVLSPHPIGDADIHVKSFRELEFVTHQDLIQAGYKFLESFSIVKAGEKFYELQGHFGRDDPDWIGGAWWVEEIDPEAYFAEVETLTSQKQLTLF